MDGWLTIFTPVVLIYIYICYIRIYICVHENNLTLDSGQKMFQWKPIQSPQTTTRWRSYLLTHLHIVHHFLWQTFFTGPQNLWSLVSLNSLSEINQKQFLSSLAIASMMELLLNTWKKFWKYLISKMWKSNKHSYGCKCMSVTEMCDGCTQIKYLCHSSFIS